MDRNDLIKAYHAISPAAWYAFGFDHEDNVYTVRLSFDKLCSFLRDSHASANKGGFYQARIRKLTKAERAELLSQPDAAIVGTVAEREAAHANGLSRGDWYEMKSKLYYTGEAWTGHDSTVFFARGDYRVNGEEVQAKTEGAELGNEKLLQNIMNGKFPAPRNIVEKLQAILGR